MAPHVVSLNASLLLKFLGFFRSRIARLGKKVVVAALLAAKDIRSSFVPRLLPKITKKLAVDSFFNFGS